MLQSQPERSRDTSSLQSQNTPYIAVMLDVSQLEIPLMLARDEQPSNICLMPVSVMLAGFHPDRSRFGSLEQPRNILPILVTLDTFQLAIEDRSVRLEQPLNIEDAVVVCDTSSLDASN